MVDFNTVPPIHLQVGNLNTEAKCLTYLAVPAADEPTPYEDAKEALRLRGAFEMDKGAARFNVLNILREMGGVLLDDDLLKYIQGGVEQHYLVGKMPGLLTESATALSGLLLAHSAAHSFPLRRTLGEKVAAMPHSATGTDTIQARLAVLDALVNFSGEAGEEDVSKATLLEYINCDTSITQDTLAVHIRKLRRADLLVNTDGRRTRVRFGDALDSGVLPHVIVSDLMARIRSVEAGSEDALAEGQKQAAEIFDNRDLVPILARRSFGSTKHTGKLTPH